jgi:hypothetical protein
MLGEDLSGRFDYLFEPLEVDESAGDDDDAAPVALEEPDDEGRWFRRIVLSGVVLATLAIAAGAAIVLLQPTQPAQPVVTPSDYTPPSTTGSTPVSTLMSTGPPTTTAEPVPALPATVSTSAIQTSRATPTGEPPPPPVEQPTTIASEPPGTAPPPPATRAPISVSPESRPPFPNQGPPRDTNGHGGLLGGLL